MDIALLSQKIYEQFILVAIAVMIAVVAGISLGIIIRYYPKFRVIILGAVNIIQTIPSLALLAFLLPVFGIGFKPALIALSLYAVLPILRNTVVGLSEVSGSYIEAAKDLGASKWHCLFKIELPLAKPMIIAGIRTALAMTVGIATIAAFIGAGGLGDYITRGLAMNDNHLLLMGAIPAALMALILDNLFGLFQKNQINFKTKKIKYFISIILIIIITVFVIIFYNNTHNDSIFNSNTNNNTITIGSKSFTEQNIISEIAAELIENKTDIKVIRKLNLGTTEICMTALEKGDIDIYPEYTGTAYLTVLHKNINKQDTPESIYNYLKNYYIKHYNIIWLEPLGFNNSQALIITEKFSQKYNINKISDLYKFTGKLHLGAPPEFLDRSDGYPAVKNNYNITFKEMTAIDPALAYTALINKEIDIVAGFSTDARIFANNLRILQDNKKTFPPYQAVFLINQSTLKKYPDLENILNQLSNQINNKTIQTLNAEVDIQKKSPADVAHAFLLEKHFI